MHKKGLLAVIVIVVAVFLGLYFLGNKKGSETPEVVRIGAILPLTGKFADAGNSVKAGLEIAIRELNESSNNKFKAIYYDTQSEVKNTITGYSKLKGTDKCEFIFSSMSDHCLALKPLIIKDSVIMFCIASHPEITKDNHQLAFRPANTGTDEADFMVEYVKNNITSNNIFVYSYNADAGLELEKRFKSDLSDKVKGTTIYEEDLNAVRNIASKARYKDADIIVVIGYSPTMGSVIKSLRESGFKGEIITNSGFNNPSVLNVVGDYAKGILYTDYDFPYQTKEHKMRDSIALADYKSSFSSLSYMSYVPMFLLDSAYKTGNYTTKQIGEFLSIEREYDVKGAKFTANKDGDIKPQLKIIRME
jgi:branched-chain amino acid transport system substrate-binding protein